MKKNLIALAVAATMVPAIAAAEGASISGFADITLTSDNDENVFGANAELDIRNTVGAVTVGADIDFTLGTNATPGTSNLEQAFFAWGAAENVTVIAGVINNPIGWEAEDAPGLYQVSHGQIYDILDSQTALYGNNIAGLAVAYNAGIATITAAVLNDIGHTNMDDNSLALVVNLAPMEGLALELGYVTQEEKAAGSSIITTAGNVVDFNATFTAVENLMVGFEYLAADNIVDSAMGITGNYAIMDNLSATLRYDVVSFEAGGDDSKSTTVAFTYGLADNLDVLLEYRSDDKGNGTDTDSMGVLEFIASF